jgi:hypothetical protein
MVENLEAFGVRRHELRETRLHGFVPNFGFVLIGEAICATDDFLQQLLELRIALLIRAGGARQSKRGDQREQHRQGVPHGASSAI